MKQKILIVFTIIICMILCSCTLKGPSKDYKTPAQQAEELQTKIMECFINKDKETLKSFFSKKMQENHDLDKEIDEAFEMFDGEIVSYDEPDGSEGGGLATKQYSAITENIITDKNTEYSICFHGYLTNEENPEKIGIRCLSVLNEDLRGNHPNDHPDIGCYTIGDA